MISDETAAFAAAVYLGQRNDMPDPWAVIAWTVEVAGLGSYHPDTIETAAFNWMTRHLAHLPDPSAVHEALVRLRGLPK